MRSANEKQDVRTLRIWLVDLTTAEERFPELKPQMNQVPHPPWVGTGYRRLILKTVTKEREDVAVASSYYTGSASGMAAAGSNRTPWNGPSVFVGSAGRTPEEDAVAFSDLEITNRQDELLPALRILETRLQRLSILLLAGQAVIHGHISGLSRQVPVQFMGEGIRRLLSILLAIHQAANGNVLIDEIDNGFHYSVLKDVWRAIALAARQAAVQVFATTHSWECVRYAREAFEQDTIYDLRLHRLERFDDRISAVSYNKEMIETALRNGLEMR